jgi:hypothetical protein
MYKAIPKNKLTPVNAWNIVIILWFLYLMCEMRWHFNIKVCYLLFHETPSYLKKWKGSNEKLFNTSTSYCIPKDKDEFHWILSLQKIQDFNLYSFIRTSWQNLWYWDPVKLKQYKLPSNSGYLLALWGTLHSAKTEWLRIWIQSCQRIKGHMATTENYTWQAQTCTELKETTGKTWTQNNTTRNWGGSLKFVQFMKKHIYYSGIKTS